MGRVKVGVFVAVLLFGSGVGAVLWKRTIPRALEQRIPALIQASCRSCRFTTRSIQLSAMPLGIVLINPRIVQGDPNATEVDGRAARVSAALSLWDLRSGYLRFRSVRIEEPQVVVTEGDLRSPPAAGPEASVPSFLKYYAVDSTQVVGGDFVYRRIHGKRIAALHVAEIQASIGSWGTTSERIAQAAHGEAEGFLEGSGHFNLDVKVPLFQKELQIDVALRIEGQNLDRINPYFQKNDGIKFAGTLVRGSSAIAIRGKSLHGWVQASYFDLDIHFEKTRDRGATTAFFSNLAKSLRLTTSNMKKLSRNEAKPVHLHRERQETILQFIFRGMKVAALQVAMS